MHMQAACTWLLASVVRSTWALSLCQPVHPMRLLQAAAGICAAVQLQKQAADELAAAKAKAKADAEANRRAEEAAAAQQRKQAAEAAEARKQAAALAESEKRAAAAEARRLAQLRAEAQQQADAAEAQAELARLAEAAVLAAKSTKQARASFSISPSAHCSAAAEKAPRPCSNAAAEHSHPATATAAKRPTPLSRAHLSKLSVQANQVEAVGLPAAYHTPSGMFIMPDQPFRLFRLPRLGACLSCVTDCRFFAALW